MKHKKTRENTGTKAPCFLCHEFIYKSTSTKLQTRMAWHMEFIWKKIIIKAAHSTFRSSPKIDLQILSILGHVHTIEGPFI